MVMAAPANEIWLGQLQRVTATNPIILLSISFGT